MNRFLHGVLAVLLLAAFGAAGAADAAPAAGGWDLAQLMHGLSQVRSAKGRFVERKMLAITTTPLEFSGTLAYTAPDRLEKRTLLPRPESMLLEGERLTLENARQQRRTVVISQYPVIWAFVESIRSTLAGDLATLARFYRVSLEGGPDAWRLLLIPNEPAMQKVVREIRIAGSKNRVATVEIIEAEGDKSVMTITEDAP
jgi:Outer membrane lipoprotein carrier protein LolA-like